MAADGIRNRRSFPESQGEWVEVKIEEAPHLPRMTQSLIFIWEEDPYESYFMRNTNRGGRGWGLLASSSENLKLIQGSWKAAKGKGKSLCLFVSSLSSLYQLL